MAPLTRLLQLPQISYVEELLQNRRVLVAGLHHHPPLEALAGAAQVTALDPSALRIAYSQHRLETHNVTYVQAPLHQTGLTVASFDVVLTGALPLETAEGRALLTELRRLLDPEGCLIFTQPGPGSLLVNPLRPQRVDDPNRLHLVLRRYFSHVELLFHQSSLTSTIAPTLHALPSWRASTPPELPPGQDFIFLCSQLPVQAEERLIASTSLRPWRMVALHQQQRFIQQLEQLKEERTALRRRVEVLERLLQTLPMQDEPKDTSEAALSPNTETVALPVNAVELQALKDTVTGLSLTLQTRDQTVQQLQTELSRLQARQADLQLALEEAEGTLETSERLRQLQSERLEEAAQLLEHQYQEREALRARGEALQTALEQARESARALPDVLAESGLLLEAPPPAEPLVPAQLETELPPADSTEHVLQALAPSDAEEALRQQRLYYEELLTKERLKTWMLEEKLEVLAQAEGGGTRGWVPPEQALDAAHTPMAGGVSTRELAGAVSAVLGAGAASSGTGVTQHEALHSPPRGSLRDAPSSPASAVSDVEPAQALSAAGMRNERALFEEERTDELEASLQTHKPQSSAASEDESSPGGRRGDDWFSAMFDNSIPPTRMESEAQRESSPSASPTSSSVEHRRDESTPAPVAAPPGAHVAESAPAPVKGVTPAPAAQHAVVETETPRESPLPAATELASATPREQHDGLDTPFMDDLEEVEQEALPPVRRQGDVFSRPFRALDQTIETSQLSPGELKAIEDDHEELSGEHATDRGEAPSPEELPLPPLPKPDEATQRALLEDWDKPAERLLSPAPPIPPAPGKSADQLLEPLPVLPSLAGTSQPPALTPAYAPARDSSGGVRVHDVQRMLDQLATAEAALSSPAKSLSKPEIPLEEHRKPEPSTAERGISPPFSASAHPGAAPLGATTPPSTSAASAAGPTPLMPGRVTWPASPGAEAQELDLPQRGELALLDALSRMNAGALPSVTRQEADELEQVVFDKKTGLAKRPSVELPPALTRPGPPIPAALDRRRKVRPIQERPSTQQEPAPPVQPNPADAIPIPQDLGETQPSPTFMKRFLGKFWK